jgi:predicted dehydrogenase
VQEIGVGIIGFGWFAELIAESLSTAQGSRLVAIAEIDSERRQLIKTKYPHVRPLPAAEKLIADKDVDVVIVATPPITHARLGKKALLAGKHLFLEKPGALNPKDMAELKMLADNRGLKASIDFVMRRNPLYWILKQLQERSVFGQPERAFLENYAHDDHLAYDHWFWDVNKSGGIWIEHGVHFFDLTNWILGPVKKSWSDIIVRPREAIIDRVVGTAIHDNDCIVSYYHGFTKPELFEATTFDLVWERAYAHIEGWIPTRLSLDALITAEEETYIKDKLIPKAQTFLPGITLEIVSTDIELLPVQQTHLKGRGKEYRVTGRLKLSIALSQDRWTVYRYLIRQGIVDLCRAVGTLNYQPAVTLNDAYEALKVAFTFTTISSHN